MKNITFKKVGENEHGPVASVINEKGFIVGSVSKWHGLFIATDWEGNKGNMPFQTRRGAGERLNEEFEFMATARA